MEKNTLKPKSSQISLFYKTNIITNNEYEKAQLLLDARKELTLFDGNPVQIPTINELPQEVNIPIIILNSKDNVYTCNISLNRVDLICKTIDVFDKKFFEQIEDKITTIFNFFQKKSGSNRIGFVFSFEYETKDKINFVYNNFLNKENLKNPKEILLRYVSEYTLLEKVIMNHLITLSGDLKSDTIKVLLDINTAPENTNTLILKNEDIKSLFTNVYTKIQDFVKQFSELK
jgi:hypothetical protein